MISKGALPEFQKVPLSHKTAVGAITFLCAGCRSLLQRHSETIDIPLRIPFP